MLISFWLSFISVSLFPHSLSFSPSLYFFPSFSFNSSSPQIPHQPLLPLNFPPISFFTLFVLLSSSSFSLILPYFVWFFLHFFPTSPPFRFFLFLLLIPFVLYLCLYYYIPSFVFFISFFVFLPFFLSATPPAFIFILSFKPKNSKTLIWV